MTLRIPTAMTTALLLLSATPLRAAESGEGEHHQHGSMTLPEYVARMEDPKRIEWQKPDELVAALGLRDGARVLDLGAGPGYFTLRLAKAVGAKGHVFAADVEAGMLQALLDRMKKDGVKNVSPLLVPPDDPTLPEGSVDLVFVCDTYHHLEDRAAYLAKLARCLAKGGRLVVVDFHKKELPVGPPMEMKLAREEVLAELEKAGFKLVKELTLLPYQYVLVASR